MTRTKLIFILPLLFFLEACIPEATLIAPMREDEGELLLYLQPMPQAASNLRFTIGSLSSVRDDGSEIPLALSMNDLKGADLTGAQKWLASARLPEGTYRGLTLKIDRAFLLGEEGETALLIPEAPVSVEHPFQITGRRALTLFLTFKSTGSITGGMRFTPVFSLSSPGRGLVNFTGCVSLSDSDSVLLFDKRTMQVTGVVSTGRQPQGMVLDQQRARVYVASQGEDIVEAIDLLEEKIIGRVKLNVLDEPMELGLSPDGRTLVSVNRGSNTVSIIDPLSLFEIRRIRVGESPSWTAVDPSGQKAFVMNRLSNTLSVVDLTQGASPVSFAIDGAPLRGAFNRRGDRLYIIMETSPTLLVIDPSRLSVTERIFIGPGAVSVETDTRTDRVFVGREQGTDIAVIDPFSLISTDAFPVEGSVVFMTIDNDENTLYVLLPDRKTLQKINLTSKEVLAELEVGGGAHAVVVMGER